MSTERRLLAVAGAGVFLILAVVLAWGPVKREWATYSLVRELTWAPIPAPPGGQFEMGCVPADDECRRRERPRHRVTLFRPFELMAHEVTVAQFQRFAEVQDVVRLEPQPEGSADDHAVVYVTWDDATAFCAFVRGRLPTEAEWEYAARGGNADAIYPWGNEYSRDQANGARMGGADRWERTAPVGSFPPNGFGLYDMAGNVWEWTSTVYGAYPYRGDDGREDPDSREDRVVRGGSWDNDPGLLRVSGRPDDNSPTDRHDNNGFRCARDVFP